MSLVIHPSSHTLVQEVLTKVETKSLLNSSPFLYPQEKLKRKLSRGGNSHILKDQGRKVQLTTCGGGRRKVKTARTHKSLVASYDKEGVSQNSSMYRAGDFQMEKGMKRVYMEGGI